jgi:non-ribosomal peptide synthase protein (TIGR01720 family)
VRDLSRREQRDLVETSLDTTRTVGWFTTIYPVQFVLQNILGPGETLMAVKEQLRRARENAPAYALLRYGPQSDEQLAALRRMPGPEVSFNYFGQLDGIVQQAEGIALDLRAAPSQHSPRARRSHLIELNGFVAESTLTFLWRYSGQVHRHSTIQQVADDFMEQLRQLIHHCLSPQAGGYTPADFSLAQIDRRTLERVVRKVSGHPRKNNG